MKAKYEFHVIDREEQKVVFLPQLKIYCEVNDEIGQALKAVENNPEIADEHTQKILLDFEQALANIQPTKTIYNNTINGITLMLATDCNMKCTYCFADEGSYQRDKGLMSAETARKAIEVGFALSDQIRGVRFFGGEPLLDFPAIKAVCEQVNDQMGIQGMRYNLETNGTKLTPEIADFLKKYDVNINISYDGPKELHDKHRIYHNGQGSYDKVKETINMLQAKEIDFSFQCTYTEAHKSLDRETLTKELTQFSPHYKIAPCIHADGTMVHMDEDFLFGPLAYLTTDKPLYHTLTMQYLSPVISDKNPEGFCEGQSRFTVFPDGSVYPCEMLDSEHFYMGSIFDPDFPGEAFYRVREKLDTFKRDVMLKGCWFRYLPNPLCIATCLGPELDPNKLITLSSKSEDIYEKMILEVLKIRNGDKWDIFLKNAKNYFQKRRNNYETY